MEIIAEALLQKVSQMEKVQDTYSRKSQGQSVSQSYTKADQQWEAVAQAAQQGPAISSCSPESQPNAGLQQGTQGQQHQGGGSDKTAGGIQQMIFKNPHANN